MTRLRVLIRRLRGLFLKQKLERELDEEIRAHLGMQIEENVGRGMNPEEARYAALRKFGGVEQVKESYRERRGLPLVESTLQDIRYALRMLRHNPGFSLIAVITLALGIGANTAIFSVLQSVVLAQLPYGQPERLVMVWQKNHRGFHIFVSGPNFHDWKRGSRSFEQIAGIQWQAHNLTSPGPAEHVEGRDVSSNFFSTLALKLALGREFSAQEDRSGAPVVIISDSLWKNRFGGSPEAIGRPLTMDGIDYTVVGILPPGFRFVSDADVYTPLGQIGTYDRSVHGGILCIGRLKPEVTADQAQAEMRAIQSSLNHVYPNSNSGLSVDVVSLKQEIVGDTDKTLFLLLGAVTLVLLIACANVADLMLARSAARSGEFAVRLALGASRGRIVSQLITESLILSLAGGVLGLVIAIGGVRPILVALPGNLPRSDEVGVNIPVLLFAFGLALFVGVLFGVLPAFRSSRTDLQTVIRQGGRGTVTGHNRAQSLLVIGQMALTLLLLTGASLLFRTVHKLWNVNPGFDTRHIVTFKVGLSPSLTKTPQSTRIAYQQLIDRIRSIPGVNAADLTNGVPLARQVGYMPFWVGNAQPASISEAPRTVAYNAGPDYFRVMGIQLLRGRFFTPQDTVDSEPVVIIDSFLANAYFPGKDPVGQIITVPETGAWKIIGVVGHVDHVELGKPDTYSQSQAYASFYQVPDRFIPNWRSATIVVRTSLAPATLLPAIKKEVYGSANDQPVYDVKTIEEIVSDSMSSQRLVMILFGAFALLALSLAAVGIYGVFSYLTTLRAGEIGIRMALGAERGDVLRMVLAQGMRLAVVGIVIGIIAALILGRLLSSFARLLYGVGSSDPLTLIPVALVLIGATLLACYVPARRAANV
ncbi:MAG: ABC transporter permease, partial [Blastocatellia bacterium]|nr:ABC transporter permease [Blastocatellia bacterium]